MKKQIIMASGNKGKIKEAHLKETQEKRQKQ